MASDNGMNIPTQELAEPPTPPEEAVAERKELGIDNTVDKIKEVDVEGGVSSEAVKPKSSDETKSTRKKAERLRRRSKRNTEKAGGSLARTQKPRAPVDVEMQCGVQLPNGVLCARSLACKLHSLGAKRAVLGRSKPYDVIFAAYERRHALKARARQVETQDAKEPKSS